VLDDLGDKIVAGLAGCVEGARRDLVEYRQALPHVVRRSSSRGLANWVHDAMWARAVDVFDEVAEVDLVDAGPVRDIFVGTAYHLRMKRHSARGAIRSYPTQAALRFIEQEDDLLTLVGIRTLNLCVGYEWDDQTREMGSGVMSLRDGSFDDVIWMHDLPLLGPAASGGTVAPLLPAGDSPTTPAIEIHTREAERHGGAGGETP